MRIKKDTLKAILFWVAFICALKLVNIIEQL
jgi:hypothetical protein